jgi:leader peptidase (prepilin peptidase)/N-methyltransferase
MINSPSTWLFPVALFILGAIWGSFAAALCARWPQGESIVAGRSRCDHCRQSLRAFELVPILSFAVQGGSCRRCAQPIGRDSLYVELFCAAFGAVCALLFAPLNAVAVAAMAWLLVPLILLDWRHFWLPDPLVAGLAECGLLAGSQLPNAPSLTDQLIGGVAGFAVLQAVRLGYRMWKNADGMGGGDPKLFGAIGLWTGWQALPVLMMLASAIGLACFLISRDTKSANSVRLPFGSFLCVAVCLWLSATGVLALF